jgi:putative peptide maturation dehydrogenase
VDSSDALTKAEMRTVGDLVRKLGQPPAHCIERSKPSQRIRLEVPAPSTLSNLMAARVTCRKFDRSRELPSRLFATLMHRVVAAQATLDAAPGATFLKKTSPSGGGLHATEAYLLVQHVEGVAPGLYHYHSGDHALEPLALPAFETGELQQLAHRCVAGQTWFADAHVLVMFAPRFLRSFWKYRNHAKAYRALVLDVGHLSQTLYLTATELGLGAFVTSAINEIEIEHAFGLDPIEEGPLAVCGFGWRGSERVTVEFDPAAKVWPLSPPH